MISREANRDFQKWFEWQKKYSRMPIFNEDRAYEVYNVRFPCECESCTYNKLNGHMPTKLRDDCKQPVRSR